MNIRYKMLFIVFLSLAIGISACKEEKKTHKKPKTTKKIIKTKASKKKIEKVVPKAIVKKAINKYFLIKASFRIESNAKRMKSELQKEGYNSQILLSKNNFYRVSYKGFSKRNIAFKELKLARSSQGTEDVWLHIKH